MIVINVKCTGLLREFGSAVPPTPPEHYISSVMSLRSVRSAVSGPLVRLGMVGSCALGIKAMSSWSSFQPRERARGNTKRQVNVWSKEV